MSDSKPLRVLIAGGGTGGHLYPGIAVAQAIAATGGEAIFVGTERGLETRLVPKAGFPLELIKVSGLKRMGLGGLARGLGRLPRAYFDSRRILRRLRPDVVLGVGGYASGPIVLAAALSGYPTAVQEQNSVPGFTNRILGRFARRVFVAFDEAASAFARRKVRFTGNPVRRALVERAAAFAGRDATNAKSILILGGSQGSHAVNEFASGMVRVLDARGRLPPIVHQTGPDEHERMRVHYAALGYEEDRVQVRSFIDDMPAALADAQLVVARAGALTLAELAIMRRPAILIPLPTAADNHQAINAFAFQRAGAALVLPQPDASATRLGDLVDEILNNPARHAAMAEAMGSLARPQATDDIVAELHSIGREAIVSGPKLGSVHAITARGGVKKALMFRKRDVTIHFVGIGGIGMSGIAEVLLNLGYPVSGSDLRETDVTRRLGTLGARLSFGHRPENVAHADVVVISSAVRADNPEVAAARARSIPVIPRAEMLGELMRVKDGVAVAGSHGKTTTTTMIAVILAEAGLDPTAIIGGKARAFGSNARLGQGEILVAEADESDGSFRHLFPTVALITNIDREHLDHFGSLEALESAFLDFAEKVPFYGLVVIGADNPTAARLPARLTKRHLTYGLHTGDWRGEILEAGPTGTRFRVRVRDRLHGEARVRMPGVHYAENALGALCVADFLGVPFAEAGAALAAFQGVDRRFSLRGEAGGVLVVDDYGHHPTELAATIAAARLHGRRLLVAFQPHRYTRTRDLLADFAPALSGADQVFLTDVYAAGEAPIAGADARALLATFPAGAPARHVPRAQLTAELARASRPGDLVLCLGAGDITAVPGELLAALGAPGEVA